MNEQKVPITPEQKQRPTTVAAGETFYTKNALVLGGGKGKAGTRFTAPPGSMFIGVLIGMLPNATEPPGRDDIIGMLGEIGFVGLDDIGEILGNEKQAELLAGLDKKYNQGKAEAPPPSGLVDASGRKL